MGPITWYLGKTSLFCWFSSNGEGTSSSSLIKDLMSTTCKEDYITNSNGRLLNYFKIYYNHKMKVNLAQANRSRTNF